MIISYLTELPEVDFMWTVVYMAQSREILDTIQSALDEAQILYRIKTVAQEAGGEENCFEILVPEAEVEQAHNIIIDIEF